MIRAVSDIGYSIASGDVFEIVADYVAFGGYEYKKVRRTSDGRIFSVSVGDLADDGLFEDLQFDREEADRAANEYVRHLAGLETAENASQDEEIVAE